MLLTLTAAAAVCFSIPRFMGWDSEQFWLRSSLVICLGAPMGSFLAAALVKYVGFRRADQRLTAVVVTVLACMGFGIALFASEIPMNEALVGLGVILAAWLPQLIGLTIAYYVGRS